MITKFNLGELAIVYRLITPPVNLDNIKIVHRVYYALKEINFVDYGILYQSQHESPCCTILV